MRLQFHHVMRLTSSRDEIKRGAEKIWGGAGLRVRMGFGCARAAARAFLWTWSSAPGQPAQLDNRRASA